MDYNNKNRVEEKVFSVTMTEEELKLFSEFLEQKEFNSKAQKARRRKFDLRTAQVASDGFNPDFYFKPSEDDLVRKGRSALRSNKTDLGFDLTKTSPLHENINLAKPDDILKSKSRYGTNIPSKERVINRLGHQDLRKAVSNDNSLTAYDKIVKRARKFNNEKSISSFVKKHGKTAALIAIPTAVAIGTGTAIYKKNKKNKDNKKNKED